MTHTTQFQCHSSSQILTPDAGGIATLRDCLARGASISAQSSGVKAIEHGIDGQQWLLCETSGSSGRPKVIRRTPESWIKSFEINADHFDVSPNDIYATLGSLGHSLTLYATTEALHLGADLCALERKRPQRQIEALRDLNVTVLYATPTQLSLLIKGAFAAGVRHLPSVRRVFSGGGKLELALRTKLHPLFPNAKVFEFFGASETSFVSITDGDAPAGSVGKLYPGVAVTVDTTIGADAGELWISSPYLFDGYEGDNHPDTQWRGSALSIGEMGYIDKDGFLFLCGRKNRMVTIADVNVFLEGVEQAVMQLTSVDQCAVVAAPDEMRGHRLVCFVQSEGNDMNAKTIRDHCRHHLPPQSVPNDIRFLDELPLLAAGKPDLQKLTLMATDQ
ncbi:AMP-binding protein [Loktanella sp. S4079]|uniref:AMP-binding protein n=1 Tax=Loktanella sp. S4079 TaxID=579483 RepID=UPI0005FA8BD8|nr:AMP-binding protein [Loktanella sp. S4079]KJZ19178.1 hypothetical protein TW80_10270 [Loktanella sp. S4079]